MYNGFMYFEHDSLDRKLRDPQGAAPCGETVTLRLRTDGEGAQNACFLVLEGESLGQRLLPMAYEEGFFSVRFRTPEKPGLLHYCFLLRTKQGDRFYCGSSGKGCLAENARDKYQLTVYDGAFETPEWFKEAVVYQIFPDRFARSNKAPLQEGKEYHEKLGRRVRLHKGWEEEPFYTAAAGEKDYKPDDYFGGDLNGIREKLPYLKELGITCLYLNPVFEADSNHRYNTADYEKIDPLLGTEADFQALLIEAKALNIALVLDGVFSHTGADSVYFNKEGCYRGGAYQDKSSPYYPWYRFFSWPDSYECWWGFDTLPNVEEKEKSYGEFIHGDKGVLHRYLTAGAKGWRLDVADELPDCFIKDLRRRVKAEGKDNVLLGEVWEDCSNKQGPEGRRAYVDGDMLDGAMNYPLRTALLNFCGGKSDAFTMEKELWRLFENYPKPFYEACLNLLSSHDEVRAVSFLAGGPNRFTSSRAEQAAFFPDQETLAKAKERFLAATALQFFLPGAPCVYYGDEAGLTGMGDPFNRRTYPWGREDTALQEKVKALIHLRRETPALVKGSLRMGALTGGVYAVIRRWEKESYVLAVNASDKPAAASLCPALLYKGPAGYEETDFAGVYREVFTGEGLRAGSTLPLKLPERSYRIYKKDR